MIGLCGAQGVGKTTLAIAYAKKHNVKFVETRASDIFKENGLDPSVTYGFDVRLNIQEKILARFIESYRAANWYDITDRTPLDLMAYTLSECLSSNVPDESVDRLEKYLADCFDVTNKYFSTIVLVQPGIAIVKRKGKASTSKANIEHISTLVLGLSVDERLKAAHFYLPRHMTDLEERVSAVDFACGRARKRAEDEYRADNTLRH